MKIRQFIVWLVMTAVAAGAAADDTDAQPADTIDVILHTNLGSITLALEPSKAPATVASFLRYVDTGYYDGTLFHRVIPGFMAQGGGFEPGLEYRQPAYPAVANESFNGLRNLRGTVSMARRSDPESASTQFFINVDHNPTLDAQGSRPGYTVFGRVKDGLSVVDEIVLVETATVGRMQDVPKQDIVILSARRAVPASELKGASTQLPAPKSFQPGTHYTVLQTPVPTRDSSRIEVVQAFAYGCPHCFRFETLAASWHETVADDVDFHRLPAVWNEPMALFARVYYSAAALGVGEEMHLPLYDALLVKQQMLGSETALVAWFERYGVEPAAFVEVFNSEAVSDKVRRAEERTRAYELAYVPQVVVNGRYVVDAMRAGSRAEMLAVVEHLVSSERERLAGQAAAESGAPDSVARVGVLPASP